MYSTFSLGLLLAATVSALPQASTNPACQAAALEAKTWTDLNLDTFMADWAKANVTEAATNNVQKLASSFGAPNFFCGIDNFCNAGQPCEPVTLPSWYGLLSIQNWNSYMNNINTAVNFASSILSLQLPQIVTDLGIPQPPDNATPFNKVARAINTVISLIPFTGTATGIGQQTVTTSLVYAISLILPPDTTDRFLQWSSISNSVGSIIQEYQKSVSTAISNVLNAPLADATNGILKQVEGGRFMGTSENFTQSELQSKMIDSFRLYAASLALQAQHIYVVRTITYAPCGNTKSDADPDNLCVDYTSQGGNYDRFYLYRSEGDNSYGNPEIAQNLIDKFGISKEKFLEGTYKCFVNNDRKQLPDVFSDSIPIDPATDCLFMLQVCDLDDDDYENTASGCRQLGLTLE